MNTRMGPSSIFDQSLGALFSIYVLSTSNLSLNLNLDSAASLQKSWTFKARNDHINKIYAPIFRPELFEDFSRIPDVTDTDTVIYSRPIQRLSGTSSDIFWHQSNIFVNVAQFKHSGHVSFFASTLCLFCLIHTQLPNAKHPFFWENM